MGLMFFFGVVRSQSVDSIAFHLYTDSLKKGQHNYINVDGKLSGGHWLPLTSKEIQFSSSIGTFEGNDLVLPINCNEEKVEVKALFKTDSSKSKSIVIWIKQTPDPDKLPGLDQIIKTPKRKKGKH